MFRLLRYYSLASLICIVLAAVSLGIFHHLWEKDQLISFVENRNTVLAQDFFNTLWPKFGALANADNTPDANTLRHADLAKLKLDIRNTVRNTATVAVEVYRLDGRRLFSPDALQIGSSGGSDPGFISARSGQTFSSISHPDRFETFNGEVLNRDILSSYIPLRSSMGGPVEGVIMLSTDITEQLANDARQQRLVTFSVVAVLTALYAVLFLIVRHADRVIRKQYEQQQSAEQSLRHATTHDTLTNLPNRVLLLDRIQQSLTLAERHSTLLAVILIDLDNFQNINNSFGHHIGDKVLQIMAQRLLRCLRESDTIARLGGDEFVLGLSDLHSSTDVLKMVKKMLNAIALPLAVEGHEFHFTASIGIALYPEHGKDMETLLRKADLAMHSAKRLGRNRHQMFAEHMDEQVRQQVHMEEEMWGALENNEFVLYYQPVVDLKSGTIAAAEALLRRPNNHGAWSSPDEFIPWTENCGLLEPLNEWILSEACAQLQAWQESKRGLENFGISINFSPVHFAMPGMATMVADVIGEARINPGKLQLEITDGLFTGMNELMRSNFEALKRLGIKFALDNFGTGYSSLGYLRNFSIDMLKIDRSLIQDLPDPESMAVITTIIALAQSLDIKVVANGIETEAQLTALQQLGCHFGQGYLFSPALPAEEFLALMFDRPDMRTPQWVKEIPRKV